MEKRIHSFSNTRSKIQITHNTDSKDKVTDKNVNILEIFC